jgi:hypothetical protein
MDKSLGIIIGITMGLLSYYASRLIYGMCLNSN